MALLSKNIIKKLLETNSKKDIKNLKKVIKDVSTLEVVRFLMKRSEQYPEEEKINNEYLEMLSAEFQVRAQEFSEYEKQERDRIKSINNLYEETSSFGRYVGLRKLLETDDEREIESILRNSKDSEKLVKLLTNYVFKKVNENPKQSGDLVERLNKIMDIQLKIHNQIISDDVNF